MREPGHPISGAADTLPSRVNAADGAETMSPQANDALDFDLYQGSLWEKY